jgi:hypothetical protein
MRMASSRRVTPEAGDLAGEHRLAERGLHERLGGQVVDLVGAVVAEQLDHRDLVEQVAGHDLDVRSWRWAMRSKFTVLDRRTMPMTS